jgi:4-amino-4-deoxy-L-arabinose transferase-like glycosyltransferase
VLIALCLAVYVPGLASLPVIDRDEARFAQASRQMLEAVALPPSARDPARHAGGLVVPMVQDRTRLDKPPLIYWAQAASAAILTGGEPLRDAIWMYRLPSLLAAIASVLITWRIGVSMFDPRAALLAGVMLAVCPLWVWEARQARADHLLAACTAASMWALWEIWSRNRRAPSATRPHNARPAAPFRWVLILWAGAALGLLAKGPITPLVVILSSLSLAALTRRWTWLQAVRPALGLLIVVAAVAPWLVLLSERYGLARYLALVYDETIGRAGSARENHFGPPGYHLVILIATFWPGSIVAGMAVLRSWKRTIRALAPWRWRAAATVRARAAELFCLAWLLPAWLVFEISATKLPHYTMPLLPALALLSARTLLAVSTGSVPRAWGRLAGTVYVLWLGVTAAIGIAMVGASLVLFDGAWAGPVGVAAPLAIILLFLQLGLFARITASLSSRRIARALRGAVWMAVIAWSLVLGLIVPRAASLWATRSVVRLLGSLGWQPGDPLASLYREGSLVFETRGHAQLLPSPAAMQEFLDAHPGALAIIRTRDAQHLSRIAPVATTAGFNIGRTARERLTIVRSLEPVPPSQHAPDVAGGRP